MEYIALALLNFANGKEIHAIEEMELRERGLIQFADTPSELALTEEGAKYMLYVKSADFASKRY